MKVKLNYTGTVDVYDVNTTYAASMNAPGLQRLCKWAEENGGNLSKETIQEEFSKLSHGAARNLFENGVVSGVFACFGRLRKVREANRSRFSPRTWKSTQVFVGTHTVHCLLQCSTIGLVVAIHLKTCLFNSKI